MIGPVLAPDKKGGWKLSPKVVSARRQRQAVSARALTALAAVAAGDRSRAASTRDNDDDGSCPGRTEESDDGSSDDDYGGDDDDDDERPMDLGAKISGKKLKAIRKKIGGCVMYSSKTEKWHCGTCKKAKMKCSFARGIYIRSNKVTARLGDHNKTKVHLEASDREASRLSAEPGVCVFFHADIS
jgi:hypothetical protein